MNSVTSVSSGAQLEESCRDTLLEYLSSRLGGGGICLDRKGNILFASKEFHKLVDCPNPSLNGRNLGEFIGHENLARFYLDPLKKCSGDNPPAFYFQSTWSWEIEGEKNHNIRFDFYPQNDHDECVTGFAIKAKSSTPDMHDPPEADPQRIEAVFWVRSPDMSQLVYVSKHFERMYDLNLEEYLKDPRSVLPRVHPDDLKKATNIWSPLGENEMVYTDFRYQMNNGSWRYFIVYRFMVYNREGVPQGIAGLSVDNTPAYIASQRLQHQQEELHEKNRELERTNRMIEDFTSFACHDLSQPLRVFHSFTRILELQYLQNINEDGKRLLESIYASVEKMQGLISRIASLSLLQPDLSELPLVDIQELVEKVVKPLFINPLDASECQIHASSLTPLKISPDHITALLENLVGNAVKYSGSPACIRIRSKSFKGGTVYTVSDNGIGIPPQAHKEIFRLGLRLNNYPGKPGSGIGLSACEKIMTIYRGKIWVHSIPGKGSTFYLFFPHIS